jgi:hypothetical protein
MKRDVAGSILPPKVAPEPGQPSLEELSATIQWRRLPSGTLRQILAAYISSGMKSMVDVVAAFQSRGMSPEKLSEVAERVLARPDVQAVLKLYSGKKV